MESISGEVTLFDLLAWEPRLQVASSRLAAVGDRDLLDREVDWVLTARSSPPMLPHLRGGELIILPQRVVAETDLPFGRLVSEIAAQPIAGVLTDAPQSSAAESPITILRISRIDADTESDLNRLLANRRRESLQLAADIDHRLGELTARSARPGELIDELSRLLRTPITITAPSGTVTFTTGNSRDVPDPESPAWQGRPFLRGQHLWIGPIARENHALIRYTIDRIGAGIQRALGSSSAQAAPVSARVTALQHLLFEDADTTPSRRLEEAYQAGIRPGQNLRVALYPEGTLESAMHRALRPLGDALPAGAIDGNHAIILMEQIPHPSLHRPDFGSGGAWAAISAPVEGAHALPQAMRQAQYVAALIANGLLPRAITRFDDDMALGAFRLLFDLWGTSLLEDYRDLHVGPLVREDTRGILLETLRVYLEQGGSQRQTAEALGIHRNTLGYRLRQIRQLLTADLDAPNTRLTLHLALIAHKLIAPDGDA
jgi:PucR family transcriptional regulator, purine catabolism regulatory protein